MRQFTHNNKPYVAVATSITNGRTNVIICDGSYKECFFCDYNTEDEQEAINFAIDDWTKACAFKHVRKVLESFEDNLKYGDFSDEDLVTLEWAFTYPGMMDAYPILFYAFRKEIECVLDPIVTDSSVLEDVTMPFWSILDMTDMDGLVTIVFEKDNLQYYASLSDGIATIYPFYNDLIGSEVLYSSNDIQETSFEELIEEIRKFLQHKSIGR